MTLLALADVVNKEGVGFPNKKTLLGKTHLSRSGLIRHIRELERLGFVTVVSRYRENGSQTSNEYHLELGGCHHVGTPPVSDVGTPPVSTGGTPLYEPIIEPIIGTNPDESGQEDSEVKIQDVIASHEPLEKDEVLEEAYRKNGEVTPAGCGFIWKQLRRTAKASGFQGELLLKELGMLKDARNELGQSNFNDAVWAVMNNWIGFTKFAQTKGGAYQLPQQPKVQFFRKFCAEAVEFAASKGSSQKKSLVKLSAKTGKELTKPTESVDTPNSEAALKALLALDGGAK